MFNKIFKLIINPRIVLLILLNKFAFLFKDKAFLTIKFMLIMHKPLNIKNPLTFNEKLQWLKLYDRNPEYTRMVDKVAAKSYVEGIVGKDYIIPTLGVWKKFNDITFENLPQQFVLKTSHDSGTVSICNNKSLYDLHVANRLLSRRLHRKYFYSSREWPYKNVKPQIIAEPLLVDSNNSDIRDYKLLIFHGEVKMIFVCSQRNSPEGLSVDFYDLEWNHLPFIRKYKNSLIDIPRPNRLDEMIDLATKIAKRINNKFVRIDFYEVNNRIYFSEITFFPGGGWEKFYPEEWDYKLGSWIELK